MSTTEEKVGLDRLNDEEAQELLDAIEVARTACAEVSRALVRLYDPESKGILTIDREIFKQSFTHMSNNHTSSLKAVVQLLGGIRLFRERTDPSSIFVDKLYEIIAGPNDEDPDDE